MKTTIKYLLAISLLPMLFACSKDDESSVTTRDLVFVGGLDTDTAESRTALDMDNYTDGDAKMGFVWTADDYIVVYDGTTVAQSSATELIDGGKKARFTVGGLKTDAGTKYQIFYGASKSRFQSTNNGFLVNISTEQTQSSADKSEHIHIGSAGDCGYAAAMAENTSFALKHLSCYYMVALTKSAEQTGVVKVSGVKLVANNNRALSASDGTSGVRIDFTTGELQHRDATTYLQGGGRQNYVNLTIAEPIELSETEKHYAYLVSAPLDNIGTSGITFTVTYTIDGGAEQTKTVTKTPANLVSGKVYRLAIEL